MLNISTCHSHYFLAYYSSFTFVSSVFKLSVILYIIQLILQSNKEEIHSTKATATILACLVLAFFFFFFLTVDLNYLRKMSPGMLYFAWFIIWAAHTFRVLIFFRDWYWWWCWQSPRLSSSVPSICLSEVGCLCWTLAYNPHKLTLSK